MRWPFRALARPRLRIPSAGDAVWWAPKQVGCTVTQVSSDGVVVFQGGELVRRPSGKLVPRWTGSIHAMHVLWDETTEAWVVGQGPAPKNVRGVVVSPEPANAGAGSQPGSILK